MTVHRAENTPASDVLRYIDREVHEMQEAFPEMALVIAAIGSEAEARIFELVHMQQLYKNNPGKSAEVIVPEEVFAEIQLTLHRERIRISNILGRNDFLQALSRAISFRSGKACKRPKRDSSGD